MVPSRSKYNPMRHVEAVAILPVSFLRRHVPVLGGALVVLMTLHGILLRLFLELLRAIFARVTYSRDPVLTFRSMEVYCGNHAQGGLDDDGPADDSSGPAATLRNMNEVLPPKQDGVFYAVVTDRFYTSIQISLQLLARNVYS
ncbi:Hypothetical protein PHPALM_2705, partial [Phytophthora palmivora]